MTPRENNVDKLLGGAGLSFVGSLEAIGVVVVRSRSDALPVSAQTLPFPLHTATVRGDMVVMRSDEKGVPENLTRDVFEAYASRPVSEEERRRFEQEAAQAVEEEEDEEDEEEEEEEAGSGLAAIVEGDEDEDGDEEDEDFEEGDEEVDDDDEDEEADADTADKVEVLQQVITKFQEQHGREPTMDEVKDVLRGTIQLQQEMGEGAEEEEEEEEEEAEEEEEEGPEADHLLSMLVEEFKNRQGRDPTEEEMKQWASVLKGAEPMEVQEEGAPAASSAGESSSSEKSGLFSPSTVALTSPATVLGKRKAPSVTDDAEVDGRVASEN